MERIAREWGRRGETTTGGGADEMLVDIRKAKLRCRLQNVGFLTIRSFPEGTDRKTAGWNAGSEDAGQDEGEGEDTGV